MGRPKLILPLGGVTVIARVVRALREGGAEPIVVVAPPAEFAGAEVLADEATRAGAVVVVADSATADMRASVELGLDRLAPGPAPSAVLLAPGDSPGITPELVRRIVARASAEPASIVVPRCRGRRGHPVALPWDLAAEVRDLPAGTGVNALLAARADRVRDARRGRSRHDGRPRHPGRLPGLGRGEAGWPRGPESVSLRVSEPYRCLIVRVRLKGVPSPDASRGAVRHGRRHRRYEGACIVKPLGPLALPCLLALASAGSWLAPPCRGPDAHRRRAAQDPDRARKTPRRRRRRRRGPRWSSSGRRSPRSTSCRTSSRTTGAR